MDSLTQFTQLRSGGKVTTPAQTPTGHDGIVLAGGICTCSVDRPGLWSNPTVMRSELASAPLPRYGTWLMRARFMLPALWRQDGICFWYSASDDPGESKQSALSVCITGDRLKLLTRSEAKPGYHEAANVAITAGRWYTLQLLANITPNSAGFCTAVLDDECIAHWAGPTWWSDAVPPFYGFGVYGGWNGSDPMAMHVAEFSVT